MVEVAVCDDRESQLQEAVATLERFAQSHRLELHIAAFQSIDAFFEAARHTAFDIVFMDIEFDGKPQGIDAVRRLNETTPNCQVVYLTSYLQYSVDVYRTDHIWFVLKKQFEERLPEIFQKLACIHDYRSRFIVVTTRDGRVVKLPCQDIVYVERQSRISRIVARTGVYEVRDKIAELLPKLPLGSFALCHSSFLVNLPCVTEIRDSAVLLDNGEEVHMSRRYARAFRERYFEWADQWTV